VFGAVYLTHGLEVARTVVEGIIGDRLRVIPTLGAALDWKTSLQEKCSALGRPRVRYEIASSGPDHAKTFTVGDEPLGDGVGRTKKEAEQNAAEQAWAALDRAAR